MALPTYSTGTATVDAGGTNVALTGATTAFNNVFAGDTFCIGTASAKVVDIVDDQNFTITPWGGSAETDAAYTVLQDSKLRFTDVEIAIDLKKQVQFLNEQGYEIPVPTGVDEPDPTWGDDGQRAFKTDVTPWKIWIKTGGVWVLQAGSPGGQGDPGVAATVTVGTVTAVAAGDPATVTNSGTANAAVLDFEIPAGSPGAIQSIVAGDNIVVDDTDPANLVISSTASGSGDVTGPSSSTDGRIALFDGTSGKAIKESSKAVSDFATSAQGAKADTAVQPVAVREKITANRTYYVDNTNGSDSNNGLASGAGNAFKTVQKAYNVVVANLDLSGFTVTIQLEDGTYAPTSGTNVLSVAQPWTGGGEIVVQGNAGAPANVLLSTTNADAILVTTTLPGILTVKDLKVTVATNGYGINNSGVGTVNFTNINFGAIAYYGAAAIGTGAVMVAIGSYAISGGGFGHILAASGGFMFTEGLTVTITGTPAFSVAYVKSVSLGGYIADGITFSGSATGKRYDVSLNSIINTASGANATYFPGNASGTSATGGQYQ